MLQERKTQILQKAQPVIPAAGVRNQEELATEASEIAVQSRLNQQDLIDLRLIDQALARIEHGTFGFCRECGEEIAEKRILSLPQAPLCITCAEQGTTRIRRFRRPESGMSFSAPHQVRNS